MGMAKKEPRGRTVRRAAERELRKGVRKVEALARELPGGKREAPIEVAGTGLVEIRARAVRCPQCGGELEVRGERAESTARGVLRQMQMICRLCHAPRSLWFRVAPSLPS